MTVLIVDDNRYVIEGLKAQIDWSSFDIDQIFGANCVEQAQKILRETPIDILFCDIEMPGKDGFFLLQWIRQQKMDLEIVLLTSYADFCYAQQAVSHSVSRYLLKPLGNEELEQVLIQLVQQRKDQQKNQRLIAYGENWASQQRSAQYCFWQENLKALQQGKEEILRTKRRGVKPPYEPGIFLLPAIVAFRAQSGNWGDEQLTFVCDNIIQELADQQPFTYEAAYSIGECHFLLIFHMSRREEMTGALSVLQKFSELSAQYLDLSVVNWKYDLVPAEEAFEAVSLLWKERSSEPQMKIKTKSLAYEKPDLEQWKRILEDGNMPLFKSVVSDYLLRLEENETIDIDVIVAFLVDWNILVSNVLKENTAYRSITQFRDNRFSQWLTADTKELECLVFSEADRLIELIATVDSRQIVVAGIKDYIAENIGEVSRGTIADHFHFSPSYLSKIFSTVEEISLADYIQNVRIERAKELLACGSKSISEIALDVGYTNFSHFSKRFRNFVGCTPNEYRKQHVPKRKKGKK